jgi:enoyl-CoA hydratase/carnithine racemase
MAHLSHSINGNIALITLNNPPQNRLSLQILDELDVALTAIGDSETRALLLRADGADFSFGGDIGHLTTPDAATGQVPPGPIRGAH